MRTRFGRALQLALVGAIATGVGASLHAQDYSSHTTHAPDKGMPITPAPLDEPSKPWSVSAGVDFTNQYFFRGILQENQGFIAQPYAELSVNFYEGKEGDKLNSMSVYGGIWTSIHSGPSGHDDDGGFRNNPKSFYEADFYAGISAGIFDKWNVDFTYTCYYSPNGSFGAVHELAIGVSFDDSSYWGENSIITGLNPYVLFAFEISNQADFGNNSGDANGFHRGGYAEIGLEPTIDIFKSASLPITFSVPIKVGLSMYDYYQDATAKDDTFGYFSIGLMAHIPLDFIPKEAGNWCLSIGGSLMVFGNTTSEMNNGRSLAPVGVIQIAWDF